MGPVPRESFLRCYPVISPSLTKLEWGDPLKFQSYPAFDLGFPEFTDPDIMLRCWTEYLIQMFFLATIR